LKIIHRVDEFQPWCSDDADGGGLASEVTVLVIPDNEILIDIGSLDAPAQGSGTLTISCGPPAAP
jgi:hypothetical protein